MRIERGTKDGIEARRKATGESQSDFVRRVLREAVNEESELARLRVRQTGVERVLTETRGEVAELRRDLAAALKAILVVCASDEKVTPEQAAAWVDEQLGTS